MPVDLDRYRAPANVGARCLVCRLLEELDDDLADTLRTVIDDPRVVWTRVEEFSEEDFGVRIPAGTASRHGRGLCKRDR